MSTLDTQIGGNHYHRMAIQPMDFIMKNKVGWCEGNAIKYICRHEFKNGAEDIEKAIHYLKKILEETYGEPQGRVVIGPAAPTFTGLPEQNETNEPCACFGQNPCGCLKQDYNKEEGRY